MCVKPDTFIGSMLKTVGFDRNQIWSPESSTTSYPEFDPRDLPQDCFCVLSSEPFPFHLNPPGEPFRHHRQAVVDGEKYSWFGVRSLRFLESESRQS